MFFNFHFRCLGTPRVEKQKQESGTDASLTPNISQEVDLSNCTFSVYFTVLCV